MREMHIKHLIPAPETYTNCLLSVNFHQNLFGSFYNHHPLLSQNGTQYSHPHPHAFLASKARREGTPTDQGLRMRGQMALPNVAYFNISLNMPGQNQECPKTLLIASKLSIKEELNENSKQTNKQTQGTFFKEHSFVLVFFLLKKSSLLPRHPFYNSIF